MKVQKKLAKYLTILRSVKKRCSCYSLWCCRFMVLLVRFTRNACVPNKRVINVCWSEFTSSALFRSLTTSFGSICLGSLFVAILRTIRSIVNLMSDTQQEFVNCILGCLDALISYFNHYVCDFTSLLISTGLLSRGNLREAFLPSRQRHLGSNAKRRSRSPGERQCFEWSSFTRDSVGILNRGISWMSTCNYLLGHARSDYSFLGRNFDRVYDRNLGNASARQRYCVPFCLLFRTTQGVVKS